MTRTGSAETGLEPLCFVLMPFGKKPDASGGVIDFDAIYDRVIAPAVPDAGCSASAPTRSEWRDHPQADVRAAAPLRVRSGRPHDGQRERVL